MTNPNPLCTDPTQTCQTSAAPISIPDNSTKHAWSYSLYVQDEWKVFTTLTVNYGVRYDQYRAYSSGNQLSPRVNAVWTPFDGSILHIGYARYFSPPPIELVSSTDISLFNNTTNAPANTLDTTPVAERADYYDAGASQQIGSHIKINLDSYYKLSKNMIDEGQFGAPIILTPFNYARGRQYGAEATVEYNTGNFNAYVNFSLEHAIGEGWASSQFVFDPAALAYSRPISSISITSNWHRAPANITYKWANTTFSTDVLYGTGLRQDATAPDGSTIPNGAHVPPYGTVNLGVAHDFGDVGWDGITGRFDVINVFDIDYQIRSGTGVGVFAPQYGQRRGFFVGLSKAF